MGKIIGFILVAVLVCVCISMLVYAAHEKGNGEECEDECNGDCLHCGRAFDKDRK